MNDNPPIPLSDRSISELRSKARELQEMAQTATTADVQTALLRLADRFFALADKRAASSRGQQDEAAD
jgi:hypothetical protein